jgi:hypothetical protein
MTYDEKLNFLLLKGGWSIYQWSDESSLREGFIDYLRHNSHMYRHIDANDFDQRMIIMIEDSSKMIFSVSNAYEHFIDS